MAGQLISQLTAAEAGALPLDTLIELELASGAVGTRSRRATLAQILAQSTPGTEKIPASYGILLTKDGTGDNTAGLCQFLNKLVQDNASGILPAGLYRTTGEVTNSVGGRVYFKGEGIDLTVIAPSTNTHHGVRIKGKYDDMPCGRVGGFTVRYPTISGNPPRNGKAGFIADNSYQLLVEDILVDGGIDIAFDAINNCFNASWFRLRTNRRIVTVNCAFNIREGNQSGADFNIYDPQISGLVTGMCIAGDGGGYRVIGGSIGTGGVPANATDKDIFGVFTLGWDYAANVKYEGLGSCTFFCVHSEGWRARWLVRAHGSCDFEFSNGGITPSAGSTDTAQQALGYYKHTEAKASKCWWRGNSTGGGGGHISVGASDVTGEQDDYYCHDYGQWQSEQMTVAGVVLGRGWLRSLLAQGNMRNYSNRASAGFARGAFGLPALHMGRNMLTFRNNDGILHSIDDGATHRRLGAPKDVYSDGPTAVPKPDEDFNVLYRAGSALEVTLGTDMNVGTRIELVWQQGSGQPRFVEGSGTIILNAKRKISEVGQGAVAQKVNYNEWVLTGQLVA